MKEFIFLYPIQPYLDVFIGPPNTRHEVKTALCQNFGDIIEARYRKRGFGVNWIMFSDEVDKNTPDMTLKAEEIDIKETDSIIVSGNTFAEATDKLNPLYSDLSYLLRQLPKGIERLYVGGFHQWDCVDKLARAAYEQGIPTLVDEDTTEVFFMGGKSNLAIPLVREPFTFNLEEMLGELWEFAKDTRAAKPWFSQT